MLLEHIHIAGNYRSVIMRVPVIYDLFGEQREVNVPVGISICVLWYVHNVSVGTAIHKEVERGLYTSCIRR